MSNGVSSPAPSEITPATRSGRRCASALAKCAPRLWPISATRRPVRSWMSASRASRRSKRAVGAVDVEDHPRAVRVVADPLEPAVHDAERHVAGEEPGHQQRGHPVAARRRPRRGTRGPRAAGRARPASAPRRAGGPTSGAARRAGRRGRRGRGRRRRGSRVTAGRLPRPPDRHKVRPCPWTSPPPSARPRCATTCSPSWTRTCIRPSRCTSARSRRAATRTGCRRSSRSSRPRRASAGSGTCSCPTSAGAPG